MALLGLSETILATDKSPKKLSRENCRQQIDKEEKSKGIESGLLEAIAQIESKLNPLSVNAAGRAYNFKTIEEAASFIRAKQKEGYRNISVGPMQLHVPSHRHNFKSLEDMLDPQKNIVYAAKFLARLKRKTGSTEEAIKLYHSPDSQANQVYSKRVFGAWAAIRKRKGQDVHQISLKKEGKSSPSFTQKSNGKKKPLKIKFSPAALASKVTE